MSKLEAKKIQYGQSIVIGANEAEHKRQKILHEAELIMAAARAKANEIIATAQYEAGQIIDDARASAQQTVDQANEESDKIRDDAHVQGIEIGREEGFNAITAEMQDKILMVDNFAEVTFEIKKKIIKSAQKDIISLISAISDKIARNSLKTSNELLAEITANAIDLLPEKEHVNIIINPELAERIYAIEPELREKIAVLKHMKFIEDSAISSDGPIVEGINSRVDARLSSQINEITSKLLAALHSVSEEELVSETFQMENGEWKMEN